MFDKNQWKLKCQRATICSTILNIWKITGKKCGDNFKSAEKNCPSWANIDTLKMLTKYANTYTWNACNSQLFSTWLYHFVLCTIEFQGRAIKLSTPFQFYESLSLSPFLTHDCPDWSEIYRKRLYILVWTRSDVIGFSNISRVLCYSKSKDIACAWYFQSYLGKAMCAYILYDFPSFIIIIRQ